MVLVGQRGAEQRHDPVAHDLIDGPLVAVDGLHHELEDRIEELPCLLRVTVGQKLHRALEVGEEDGNLLTLAFKGSLRGEDLLGQVLRRVGFGRSGAVPALLSNRLTTLQTELRRSRQLDSALRAGQCQARTTLQAELGLLRVLVLTPGTLHAAPSQQSEPGTVGQVARA
jgi:hypothetical protein